MKNRLAAVQSKNVFSDRLINTKPMENFTTRYHLPGLFEFFDFYSVFLPLFYSHREYFYDWCEIASIYGAPSGCIWNGGRTGFSDSEENSAKKVLGLVEKYGISARLTFSNSLLREEHLSDRKCNGICCLFESKSGKAKNGIIVHSEILLDYLKGRYPDFYFVSSTTKVITDFQRFKDELDRKDFSFVVPDFTLNKSLERLESLTQGQKDKVEFLCNECCWTGCRERKACYENVSRRNLGESCPDHICRSPGGKDGYVFSKAMKNPAFIGTGEIKNVYLPLGFSNFKIEGRGLGSAMILEFLLYYMTKPEYQLNVREAVYLDSMLDLF